jgi:hypothetical protein
MSVLWLSWNKCFVQRKKHVYLINNLNFTKLGFIRKFFAETVSSNRLQGEHEQGEALPLGRQQLRAASQGVQNEVHSPDDWLLFFMEDQWFRSP